MVLGASAFSDAQGTPVELNPDSTEGEVATDAESRPET